MAFYRARGGVHWALYRGILGVCVYGGRRVHVGDLVLPPCLGRNSGITVMSPSDGVSGSFLGKTGGQLRS